MSGIDPASSLRRHIIAFQTNAELNAPIREDPNEVDSYVSRTSSSLMSHKKIRLQKHRCSIVSNNFIEEVKEQKIFALQ